MPIILDDAGGWLAVSGLPDDIVDRLQTERTVAEFDDERGLQLIRSRRSLFDSNRGTLDAPGLLPLLDMVLRRRGETPELRLRSVRSVAPDFDGVFQNRGAVNPEMLNFVARQGRGIIRYDSRRVSRIHLLVQIVEACLELRIGIIVPTFSLRSRLIDSLQNRVIDGHRRVRKEPESSESSVIRCGDVVVGLSLENTDLDSLDLVLFTHPRAAVRSAYHSLRCWRCEHARFIGLVGSVDPLPRFEADALAHWFGLDEVTIRAVGHQVRPITVHWERPPRLNMQGNRGSETLRVKRNGIWRNRQRNQAIAQIAERFAQKRWSWSPPHPGSGDPMVIILVETVAHALTIAKLLPGWWIGADQSRMEFLSADELAFVRSRRPTRLAERNNRYISLIDQSWSGPLPDVLIRADCGSRGLEDVDLSYILHRHTPGDTAPRPLLLIDIEDRHHWILRRRAAHRRRSYDAWDLEPRPADFLPARYRDYLRQHRISIEPS